MSNTRRLNGLIIGLLFCIFLSFCFATSVHGETLPSSYRIYGDATGDGKIDSQDADLIQSHYVGNTTLSGDSFSMCDLNMNGEIDLNDLARLSKHCLVIDGTIDDNSKLIVTVYFDYGTSVGLNNKINRIWYSGNKLFNTYTDFSKDFLGDSNYTFIGWFTKPSGGSQVLGTSSVGITNQILYAHYQKNTEMEHSNSETESNDSFQSANNINRNKTITGSLRDGNDKDYYKAIAPSNGYIQFTMNRVPGGSHSVTLYDTSYKELWSKEYVYNDGTIISPMIGVPQGTFYIFVRGSNTSNYTFQLKHTSATNWETEFNEEYEQADIISSNTSVHGSLRNSNDKDYFKVNIQSNGFIQLSMNRVPGGSHSVSIYNELYSELWSKEYVYC